MSTPSTTRARKGWAFRCLNAAAIALLLALALIAFWPVFGGYRVIVAGVGGIVLGVLVGLLTSAGRFEGALYTAAGVVLAYLLFGVPLAVPSQAIAGVLPSLSGLRELMLGTVFAWKGLLTAEPPADGFPGLLVVPFLTMLVCAAAATALAVRLERLSPLALVPVGIALLVGILFGTRDPVLPWLVGAAMGVLAVAFVSWRGARNRANRQVETLVDTTTGSSAPARRRATLLGAVAMLAIAGTVAGAVGAVVQPSGRQVLRDAVEPPVDLADYPSPLAGYRGWLKNFENSTLLTVTGMPEGSRLRLATLDYYDGEVFTVASGNSPSPAGHFTRVGETIGVTATGMDASVAVEVGEYQTVWLPTVGFARSFDFDGDRARALEQSLVYNSDTGAAVVRQGLQTGDRFTLESVVPELPGPDRLAQTPLAGPEVPKPASIPKHLQAWASQYGTQGATAYENIVAMQLRLQQGAFSHGLEGDLPSLAGHSEFRIDEMFRAPVTLGDDEQYAVAYALALRQIGVPARVVMGMYPKDGFTGSEQPVALTGRDMHAWVEIPFEGVGWVPFDATPPEDNTEIQPEPEPKPKPKPQILQPPQPIEEPEELTPEVQPDEGETIEEEEEPFDWWPVIMGVLIGVSILLLLLLPFILVGIAKVLRRRQRRRAPDQQARLAGGWHEIVDGAVDLGLEVPRGVTRTAVAKTVADRYPQSQAVAMGQYVDQRIFGPDTPDPAEVDAFWDDVERGRKAMRREAGWRQRLRSRLSLRSFRRRRRGGRK